MLFYLHGQQSRHSPSQTRPDFPDYFRGDARAGRDVAAFVSHQGSVHYLLDRVFCFYGDGDSVFVPGRGRSATLGAGTATRLAGKNDSGNCASKRSEGRAIGPESQSAIILFVSRRFLIEIFWGVCLIDIGEFK